MIIHLGHLAYCDAMSDPSIKGCDVKIQAALHLIFVTILPVPWGQNTVRSREVPGVKVGGSVVELKAVYNEARRRVSLTVNQF
jgi:hypothetical protein